MRIKDEKKYYYYCEINVVRFIANYILKISYNNTNIVTHLYLCCINRPSAFNKQLRKIIYLSRIFAWYGHGGGGQ